jgi:molybdopterin-guanine dinucleotide biosynthesis protein A
MSNVFISYRRIDQTVAERLAREIQGAGHNVWLDIWEIDLGDSIIAKIDTGLQGSSYLLLCFSRVGVDSPWISREWMSTLARQLEGYPIKIIPVRLTGVAPPAIIADLKAADLLSDWAQGVNDLLRAIE